MGEHSVVYGHPALVAALDLRLTVRIRPGEGPDGISLALPRVEHGERTDWPAVIAYAERARRRWEAYAAAPRAEGFAAVRGRDPGHVVKVALGEAARHLGERRGPPMALSVASEIPIGSGFGSSAALAVATLGAYLSFRDRLPAPPVLEKLALEVERRQHGFPSGVDGASVLHGGLVWAETVRGDGDAGFPDGSRPTPAPPGEGRVAPAGARRLAVRPLDEGDPRPQLERFRIFDTGTPAESTGAVVAAVRERLDRESGRLRDVLGAMGRATRRFRDAVLDPTAPEDRVAGPVREFEAGLEALGVVPDRVAALVRRVEERGGVAKISGAGALSSPPSGPPGAGCLLVRAPVAEEVGGWPFLDGLRRLGVTLGAEGLRVERAA